MRHLFLIVLFTLMVFSGKLYSQKNRTMAYTVQFPAGQQEIPAEEAALLNIFIDIIKGLPENHFFILPQSPNIYQPEQVRAAKKRAEKVYNFFLSTGVPASRITMMETMESLPEDDTEGAGNRKSQVVINGVFTEAEVVEPPSLAIPPKEIPQQDTLINTGLKKPEFSFTPPKRSEEIEKLEVIQEARKIFTVWDTEPQVFVIRPERDTLIETLRGLMLYIPAHTFQTAPGRMMRKEIEVSIKEYFKKSEIVAGYYGSVLERGVSPFGIYKITAYSGGNMLSIKPDKEIYLFFPKALAEDSVQLYSGERRQDTYQMDWKQVSNRKGNFSEKCPSFLPEVVLPSGLFSDPIQEENNLAARLRKQLNLSKNQAFILKETLFSQKEYEKGLQSKGKTIKPLRESSAFVFSCRELEPVWMLGQALQIQMGRLVVEYPPSPDVEIMLVADNNKAIFYPILKENHLLFPFAEKMPAHLLAIKYTSKQVLLAMVKVQNEKMILNNADFEGYDSPQSAKKSLKILDYSTASP